MDIKYDISQFNNLNIAEFNRNIHSFPSSEQFNYVYEKARAGNEMAAIQLYEWIHCCSPQSEREKMEYRNINFAFNSLFGEV